MPIKPENRSKYPPKEEWKRLREQVLDRAKSRCELCFVWNGSRIVRNKRTGEPFHFLEVPTGLTDEVGKSFVVVLTIAHINQDPSDNRLCNLLALCQRCHLRIDQPYKLAKRAAKHGR